MADFIARLKRLEDQLRQPDAGDFDALLYDTSGELAAVLAAGVTPPMPVDPMTKPDLSASIDKTHPAQPPDHRSRIRPGDGREYEPDGPVTFAPPYKF